MADAATVIGRDAAALSRRLQALEARLGVTLVTRNTRRVSLTDEGRAYLERVGPLVAAIDTADAEIRDQASGPIAGRIKITVPSSFGRNWVAPVLLSFRERHPLVTLHVDFSDRRVDLVGEGYDLAIRLGAPAEAGMRSRRIADRKRVICVARDHPAAREVTHPTDLARFGALSFAGRERQQWTFVEPTHGSVSVSVPSILSSNNADLLIEAAIRGVGVLNTTNWHSHRALKDGYLTTLLDHWHQVDAGSIDLISPKEDPPIRVKVLSDYIISEITAHWAKETG